MPPVSPVMKDDLEKRFRPSIVYQRFDTLRGNWSRHRVIIIAPTRAKKNESLSLRKRENQREKECEINGSISRRSPIFQGRDWETDDDEWDDDDDDDDNGRQQMLN